MNVKELKEFLNKFPDDLQVTIFKDETEYDGLGSPTQYWNAYPLRESNFNFHYFFKGKNSEYHNYHSVEDDMVDGKFDGIFPSPAEAQKILEANSGTIYNESLMIGDFNV